RRRRVPDQFRRARTAHQRAGRALRPPGDLCGDLLRHPGERLRVHPDGKAGTMAQTGQLSLPATRPWRLSAVTRLRILIVLVVVVVWEAVSASGLLYRDVVPSLAAIGRQLILTLSDPSFYFHLYTTFYEIGVAMIIGGLSGLVVGIALGGSRFMSR